MVEAGPTPPDPSERIVGPGFFGRVYEIVCEVPAGRVTTYGDVAERLGLRTIARKVGHALAGLPHDSGAVVPWFRVVNSKGEISRDVSSGMGAEQAELLRAEGVEVTPTGRIVGFNEVRYRP